MSDILLDLLWPVLTISVIAWVLRSKLSRLRGAHRDVAALARSLGLVEVAGRGLARVAPDDLVQLESSAVGRAGLAVVQGLPGAGFLTYEGLVDGVRVRLSLATERKGQTILTQLDALPEAPWGLGLRMERAYKMDSVLQPGRQSERIVSGDPAFDGSVFVKSSQGVVVQRLLGNTALREEIVAFLGSQGRGTITDDGVHARLAGPVTDPTVVRPLLMVMTALVRRIEQGRSEA